MLIINVAFNRRLQIWGYFFARQNNLCQLSTILDEIGRPLLNCRTAGCSPLHRLTPHFATRLQKESRIFAHKNPSKPPTCLHLPHSTIHVPIAQHPQLTHTRQKTTAAPIVLNESPVTTNIAPVIPPTTPPTTEKQDVPAIPATMTPVPRTSSPNGEHPSHLFFSWSWHGVSARHSTSPASFP